MTKEDLLQKIDTWGVDHIAITGIKDCIKQFFESNVCIPKGATLQAKSKNIDWDDVLTLSNNDDIEYRIKPHVLL